MPPQPFTPYPGHDPQDGEDPRVTLSRDNPCRVEGDACWSGWEIEPDATPSGRDIREEVHRGVVRHG